MSETQAAHGQNSGPSPLVQEMFKSYWRIEDEKNSLRQQQRTKIGKLSEQQADVMTRIKDGGFNVRAFKELCNEEADRRRVANRKAKLDEEDQTAFDDLKERLGGLAELPLGQAAVEAAEAKQTRSRKKAQQNRELDALGGDKAAPDADKTAAAANVVALSGIKKLDS